MVTIKILLIIALINYLLYFLSERKQTNLAYCGLVGFSGKTSYNLDKIKFLMLWNSIERGRDATGIYSPNSGILKEAEPAGRFFTMKTMEGLKEDNTLLCHVRAKTVGINNAKNAHPFEYGDIVLAHNGTLVEYGAYQNGLASKYGIEYKDYDVDSQILAMAVNQNFQKEGDLHLDVLNQYKGAAALIFYNTKTDLLYVFHDKERPLLRGWDEDGNMYISSIGMALEAVGMYAVDSFAENTLFTIKDGQIIAEKKYQLYEELNPKPAVVNVRSKRANKREKKKLPKLTKGQRGFDAKDCKSSYLVGYNLKARVDLSIADAAVAQYAMSFAKLKKDKWYLVVGNYADDSSWLEIIDETGQATQVNLNMLDTTTFIPRPGDYVEILQNIVSLSNDRTRLWTKGDLAMVVDESFVEGELALYHEDLQKSFTVDSPLIRLVTEAELLERADKASSCNIDIPLIAETDDSPFKESETIPPEVLNEDDDNIPDEYIAMEIYEAFVDTIDKNMDKLEEDYLAEKDIIPNINEIKATLNLATDTSYLETLSR